VFFKRSLDTAHRDAVENKVKIRSKTRILK